MKVYKQMKQSTIDGKYCNKHFWWFFFVCFLLCVSVLCSHYSTLFAGQDGVTLFASYTNSTINVFPFTRKEENSHYGEDSVVASLAMEENSTEVVIKQPGANETGNKMNLKPDTDSCSGRYIYIHDLPSKFNYEMLQNCSTLIKWFDMCESVSNMGLGPQVTDSNGVLQEKSWYSTNQFSLEIIFDYKMKNYKCLTNDSSVASAIYVPFYAGLDVGRLLWNTTTSARDAASLDLIKWLTQMPEWKFMWGRDHFFVAGRIAWDFSRQTDKESDWGNKLMTLPEAKNMTMLTIESSPWSKSEYAIPYPTYFHPSSENEIFDWQNKVRRIKRQYLFSFVGAPRPNLQNSIRGIIIDQCLASKEKCKLLDCSSRPTNCDDPIHVMKMFQSSTFCLQPPGDSSTRRSTFDAILSGCIPVFFHPETAYNQYIWHLPKNYTKYSVFISEDDTRIGKANIEKILLQISNSEVLAMREEVIRLIPKIMYSYPGSRLQTLEDAFDIAIEKVLERVERIRKKMKEGKSSSGFSDDEWKNYLSRSIYRKHE